MHDLGTIPQTADVGGKARELDRLMRQGFTVPSGFVIDTATWSADGWQQEVNARVRRVGGLFAVRSSAAIEDTADESMAGMFLSKIRVPAAEVVAAVHEVVAHARRVCGEPISVLVQVWIEGDVSGVMFSRHPTKSLGEIGVIDAVRGGVARVVSGEATPQRCFMWEGGALIPESFPLTRDHVGMMQQIAWKIHATCGTAVDVEWTIRDGSIYVLQARPMTRIPPEHAEDREEGRIMQRYAQEKQLCLQRGDFAETMPRPSRATLDMLHVLYAPRGPFAEAAEALGLVFDPHAAIGYLTTVFGWLYADMSHEPIRFLTGWVRHMRVSWRLHKEMLVFPQRFYATKRFVIPSSADRKTLFHLLTQIHGIQYACVALLARIAEKQPRIHGSVIHEAWHARRRWLDQRERTLILQDMELGHEGVQGERREWNEPEQLIDMYAILREDAKDELRPLFSALRRAYAHDDPAALALPSPMTSAAPPLTIRWSDIFDLQQASAREGSANGVHGTGVSFGAARGLAVMPSKPSIIPSGAILVVPSLSPEWFPYLTPTLGGVISEAGSLMSHGAIQCRERGIPAIFGVVGATHRIQAGELIAIDGKKGSVLHVGERDDKWL